MCCLIVAAELWLSSHKVQFRSSPASTPKHRRLQNSRLERGDQRRVPAWGRLAEEQFEHMSAMTYREASGLIRGTPGLIRTLPCSADKSGCSFIANGVSKVVEVSLSSLLLKKQSLSPSQNHVGQLIDEFVLDAEALAELRRLRLRPLEFQFEPLRRLIREHPDYTPAAIIAAIALRQHGELAPRNPTTNVASSPIPRTIFSSGTTIRRRTSNI